MHAEHDQSWQSPPAGPQLAANEIHVWRTKLECTDEELAPFMATLSADERARGARFIKEKSRRHFIAGRGFLRATLAAYLERRPALLSFRYGLHGKPELLDAGDLHFNLSHSADCAILGVTRVQPLGVDVERIRTLANWEGIARRFFSEAEVTELAAVAASEREQAFFNCWTRKEAYIKACGEGLARPLDQFVVSLKPGAPPGLLHVQDHEDEPARWVMRTLTPYPGYVACLAIAAAGWRLRLFAGDAT